jgi:hypothetical protein
VTSVDKGNSQLTSKLAIRFTFTEVPPYSIQKWNANRGHHDPESFKDSDRTLTEQVNTVNNVIQQFNQRLCTQSPKLGLDMENCRKKRGNKIC